MHSKQVLRHVICVRLIVFNICVQVDSYKLIVLRVMDVI